MAKIGLRNFRYSKLTENTDGTFYYDGPKIPGKAINCNVNVSTNTAKLRADDSDAEVDTSVSGGTVDAGIDRDDPQTEADLLGHTVDQETGRIVRNVDDVAPYVGWGRIIKLLRDGTRRYKVEFLYKVKFAEPSQEDNTQGETISFGTHTLNGQIGALANGDWSESETFDSYTEALNYLNGLMEAPSP